MQSASPSLPRVMVIAGSDSSSGAGIQADLKTIHALGGYATTAITAVTAQNTQEVRAVQVLAPSLVSAQIDAIWEDIGADAIKIGMLANRKIVKSVAASLQKFSDRMPPLVLDPVMAATNGGALLDEGGVNSMIEWLIPFATLITPNMPEAEILTGKKVESLNDMVEAAKVLRAMGAQAVLVKGGHMEGDSVIDVLVTEGTAEAFSMRRIVSPHTHGTGCTLASAIATGLAKGENLRDCVLSARDYVHTAIRHAPGLGHGHGPLRHLAAAA